MLSILSYAAMIPMCPSFKARRDVRHSPKGRADALRDWYRARQDNTPDLAVREADLLGMLDTCLGCKALRFHLSVAGGYPGHALGFPW